MNPLAHLLKLCEEHGITSEDLDEEVFDACGNLAAEENNAAEDDRGDDARHDEAERRGSAINAGGLEAQLVFLLEENNEHTVEHLIMSAGKGRHDIPLPDPLGLGDALPEGRSESSPVRAVRGPTCDSCSNRTRVMRADRR